LGNQGKVVCFFAGARYSMGPDGPWSKQITIPKVFFALPPEVSGPVKNLTTQFHVLQRLRMSGAILLLTGMTSLFAKGHLYLYLKFLWKDRGKIMKILEHIGRRFEFDNLQTREEANH
jgi:hypothetical protein